MKKIILLFVLGFSVSIVSAKPLTKAEEREMLKQFIVFQNAVKNNDSETVKSMMQLPISGYTSILLGDSSDEETISNSVFEHNKKTILNNLKFATLIKANLSSLKDSNYFLDIPNQNYLYDKKGNYCYYVQDNKQVRVKKQTPSSAYTLRVAGANQNQLFLSKTSMGNPCWQIDRQSQEEAPFAEFLIFQIIKGKLKLVDTGAAG